MPLKMIKFGTSGWRGILADDFTFEGVRAATAAIADYVKQQNSDKPSLVIGFDPRFLSDTFAREAAAILTGRGVQSFLCQHPTPTPAIAYEVLLQKADGAINFTASHNPAEYNGLKFSTADGAPALKHVTKALEALAAKHLSAGVDAGKMDESKLEPIDPAPAYLGTLATKVDINAIQQAGISIGFDPLYGAATGYLDKFLAMPSSAGIRRSRAMKSSPSCAPSSKRETLPWGSLATAMLTASASSTETEPSSRQITSSVC
jgi:phosphoglucomutase